MKTQQVTAILLCALVGSTLGHEFLRAKRFAPEPRSPRVASPFEDRALAATDGPLCTIVCDEGGSTGSLQIVYNETNQILGIYNTTAKVTLIIEIATRMVGVFDGSNGAVFILNLKAQTGVYIAGGLTNISWISSQSSFEIFFSQLTTLQVFLNLKIGLQFTFANISNETLKILGRLVIYFSADIGVQIQTDIRYSLTILVKISLSITTLLTGSLKGLFTGIGNGLITIHGDLIWLGGVFEGFESFFLNISGGLAAVLAAKIRFDWAIFLRATSGLQLFVNFLFAFAAQGKLSLLAGLLNSNEKILALIVQLGGNVSTGVTGLFRVILHIYLLVSNKIKLEVFLQVLAEFSASRNSAESLDLDIYIQGLLKVIEISGSSSSELTVFVAFVKNLQAGKLVVGNLNVSEIIIILQRGGVTNSLQLLVLVLLRLSVVVGFGFAVTIPALFFFLLIQLRTAAGILLLNGLGIKINISISSSGSIVGQLIQDINIQSISSIFLGGFSVEKLLPVFPAFSQIYISLSTAIQASSNVSYSLSKIINSNSKVQSDIQVYVKEVVGLTATQKPETTTASHTGGGGGGLGGIFGGIFGGSSSGSSSESISVGSSGSSSGSVKIGGGGGGGGGGAWRWGHGR